MKSLPVTVGLDYSDDAIRVCVLDPDGRQLLNRDVDNSAAAVIRTAKRYGTVQGVALEACSGAADLAEELVNRSGWIVHMAHPGFVSRMKQNPDKSDFTDAQLLADLERVGYLPQVWIAPKPIRELRTLVRDRQTLARQRRTIKQQIGAVLRENRQRCHHSRWTKRWLQWLTDEAKLDVHSRWVIDRRLIRLTWVQQEIDLVEKRLEQLTASDPVARRLLALPGVDPSPPGHYERRSVASIASAPASSSHGFAA